MAEDGLVVTGVNWFVGELSAWPVIKYRYQEAIVGPKCD